MADELIIPSKTDPPLVKIQKSQSTLLQNLGFGTMITTAYLCAPLVGVFDFTTTIYIASMASILGLINFKQWFSRGTYNGS